MVLWYRQDLDNQGRLYGRLADSVSCIGLTLDANVQPDLSQCEEDRTNSTGERNPFVGGEAEGGGIGRVGYGCL